MKGFFVLFLAAVSVSVASGRVQSMWDYHRVHGTSVNPASRIIHGTPARDGDFPYQVRITIFSLTIIMGWCGGSIIAPNWVLTAGHCATADDVPIFLLDYIVFYIEAGSVVANDPDQDTHVVFTNAYPHPDYDSGSLMNDIALLKSDKAFDFTGPLVKPIKLVAANTNVNSYVGKFITVSGFGATSDGGSTSKVLLYTKSLKAISFSECQRKFGTDPIPRTSICAEDTTPPISAVCSGDSGGPATLVIGGQLVQIAIVSYASDAGCDDAPQGFTNVLDFIPWILDITGPL